MPPIVQILDTSNPLDREALFIAHDKRCPYCGAPLLFRDVEIDHIIPTHLSGKPDELASCLRPLGLPDDYNLNSFDNLLPVHALCNSAKRGSIRDESFHRHFRGIANEKLEKFQTIRQRLQKQRRAEPDLAAVAHHIQEKAVTLQDIADLTTQTKAFDPEDDFQTDDFVRLSESCVCIECDLPAEHSPGGSALLTFHPISLRGVQVKVDHDTLTRELLHGLGAPADPRWRPFLARPSKDASVSLLQFGSVTIHLEPEEVAQLCRLLDRLAPIYAEAFHRVEISFDGIGSPLISPGVYEVAHVPLPLWKRIIDFAKFHDLAKGDSEWHMFDASPGVFLRIIKRQPDSWDYLCFLEAAVQCPSAGVRSMRFIRTTLRWMARDNRSSPARVSKEWCWSPNEASRFIFERLIPKVTKAKGLRAFLPTALQPDAENLQVSASEGHKELTTADFISPEKANVSVERMQYRFLSDHDQFVRPAIVAGTFEFLSFLLATNELKPWSTEYISQKLGCHLPGAISEPAAFVADRLRTLQNPEGSTCASCGDVVDNALRSILEILRKGTPTKAMASGWSKNIKAFIPVLMDYNARNYMARLRGDDIEDI